MAERRVNAARQRPAAALLRRRGAFGALMLAAAAYGLAVFVALIPAFRGPAPAGQAVGLMSVQGLDAAGPFRAMAALILLPGLAALLLRPVAVRLAAADTAGWARWVGGGSLAAALWARLASSQSVAALVVCGVLPLALLPLRRRRIPFSRLDLLLLPAFLVTWYALVETAPGLELPETVLVAAAAVLLVRLLVGAAARPGRPPAAWCFALVPAAQLLHVHLLHGQRHWAAPLAPALALASVLGLAFLGRWDERTQGRFRRLLALAVLPAFAFALPASSGRWNGPLHVDTFEDGHHILPAAEMLRGERLYRDVVPGHGALADGGISWAAMRLFGERLDVALLADHYVGAFNSVAAYALGLAATGSPMVGLATTLFAQSAPAGALWLRTPASLAAVAFAMAAARRRDPRKLAGAGFFVVLALLTSLEMGLYAAAVTLLAALRMGSWPARRRAGLAFAAGAAALAVPATLLLLARGTLDDMVRVTAGVLSLGPVYVLGLDWLAPALRAGWVLPDSLRGLLQPPAGAQLLWLAAIVGTGAGLSASPWRGRRPLEPLLLLGAWVAVAGFSLAERHHDYYAFGLWPLLAIATAVLLRSRRPGRRAAAVVATVALVTLAAPTYHLHVNAAVRRGGFPVDGYVRYAASPRAGGALFRAEERATIERVRAAMESHLGPGETFYDFVNLPILYFLLDRPAPIEHPEVPFYQSREAQLEVVRRLERDRSVRAALVRLPVAPIDLVPNCRRAPLVWRWLRNNFQPAYAEGGVEVWVRVEEGRPGRGGKAERRRAAKRRAAGPAAWRECR